MENPAPAWITSQMWSEICALSGIKHIWGGFADDFVSNLAEWKSNYFDSPTPQEADLPGGWTSKLDSLQKIGVLRALRPDKVTEAVQNYVAEKVGQRFIE